MPLLRWLWRVDKPVRSLRRWLFICENDDAACQISMARCQTIHRAGYMAGPPQGCCCHGARTGWMMLSAKTDDILAW